MVHGIEIVTRASGDAGIDKGVRHVQRQAELGESGVELLGAYRQRLQRTVVNLRAANKGIDAGFAGLPYVPAAGWSHHRRPTPRRRGH